MHIYTYMYIERSSADAAHPSPEHVTPPRPTPGDVGGSQKPTTSPLNCPGTFCLDNGLLGSLGCPLDLSRSSGNPRRAPWGSLGCPEGSRGGGPGG